ncbi:VapA/VapB family virulence-associated protein [Marinobacter azerbaijanicus]|uniref:VapA/VapB family virulence-associated protein n=1 Tax=Marinobacter azerbaijanicus TaxID=3050455 RepID=UPI003BF52448
MLRLYLKSRRAKAGQGKKRRKDGVYGVLFFDSHSKLLGHFQSGAVSTVIGVGGGKGKWR